MFQASGQRFSENVLAISRWTTVNVGPETLLASREPEGIKIKKILNRTKQRIMVIGHDAYSFRRNKS